MTRSTAGWCSSQRATAQAFSTWRSMRTASVLVPRRTRKESIGPGTAPMAFCRKEAVAQLLGVHHHGAADDVGVAAEVLGGGVDDEVGAELERSLQVRRH